MMEVGRRVGHVELTAFPFWVAYVRRSGRKQLRRVSILKYLHNTSVGIP